MGSLFSSNKVSNSLLTINTNTKILNQNFDLDKLLDYEAHNKKIIYYEKNGFTDGEEEELYYKDLSDRIDQIMQFNIYNNNNYSPEERKMNNKKLFNYHINLIYIDSDTIFTIGKFYHKILNDKYTAYDYYNKAGEMGCSDGYKNIANKNLEIKYYEGAYHFYKKAAKLGCAISQDKIKLDIFNKYILIDKNKEIDNLKKQLESRKYFIQACKGEIKIEDAIIESYI